MSTESKDVEDEIRTLRKLWGDWDAFEKALLNLKHAKPCYLLMDAAQKGNLDAVNRLLKLPKVLKTVTAHNNLALQLAAQNGQTAVVRRLLEIPEVVAKIDADDYLALELAAKNGHLEVVNLFLDIPEVLERVTPNYLDEAIKSKNIRLVNRLLEVPTIINNIQYKSDLLPRALDTRDLAIFNLFLKIPGLLERDARKGNYSLQVAARHGDLKLFNQLLEHRIVLENVIRYLDHILTDAASGGNVKIVNRLFEIPGILAYTNRISYKALVVASAIGNLVMVNRLLDIPDVLNHAADQDNYALRSAAAGGYLAIVNRLLEIPKVLANAVTVYSGPREEYQGIRTNWVLNTAAEHGQLMVVNRLLKIPEVLKLEQTSENGDNILFRAACAGHLDIINRALEIKAVKEVFVSVYRSISDAAKKKKQPLQELVVLLKTTFTYAFIYPFQMSRHITCWLLNEEYEPEFTPEEEKKKEELRCCPLKAAADHEGYEAIVYRLCEVLTENQVDLPDNFFINIGGKKQSLIEFKRRADKVRTEIEDIVFPGQDLERRIVNIILEYAKFPEEDRIKPKSTNLVECFLEPESNDKKDKNDKNKDIQWMRKQLCHFAEVKSFSEFTDLSVTSPLKQYKAILDVAEAAKSLNKEDIMETLDTMMTKVWLDARLCEKGKVNTKAEFMKKTSEEIHSILTELKTEAEELEHHQAVQEIDALGVAEGVRAKVFSTQKSK